MKAKQLLPVLLLVAMISCKSRSALDYSEAIVKMETDLSADIADVDLKVSEYLEAQKRDSVILMAQEMEHLAEQKLKELQARYVPRVKEAENFRREAVKYFSYVRSIYTSFKRFTMAATDQEKESEGKKLARIIKEKTKVAEAMKEAQRKFAAANDFVIGQNSDE